MLGCKLLLWRGAAPIVEGKKMRQLFVVNGIRREDLQAIVPRHPQEASSSRGFVEAIMQLTIFA